MLDEELGCLYLVHVVDELPEDPDLLQLGRGLQELVMAGAGAVDVNSRIDSLLGDAP